MTDNDPRAAASAARTPEQSDYDLAMYLVADLESRLEDAHMSGDKALQAHFRDLHARALGMSHRAWDRLQAAGTPTFEDLLADPTTQLDTEGVVLRSILAYEEKTRCLECIEVTTATASVGGFQVPSRYLCMKPKPCPDHAQRGARLPVGEPS